jgi:excinuclease ABC subunit A
LDFPIHKPIQDLSARQLNLLWEGGEGVYGINDFFKDVEAHLYKVQFRVLLMAELCFITLFSIRIILVI